VLDGKGVVVSDRNAAAGNARFHPTDVGLTRLDIRLVMADRWNVDGDSGHSSYDRKQIACAEVLVPDRIPGAMVKGPGCRAARAKHDCVASYRKHGSQSTAIPSCSS
jgi:hypothetical protein